MATYLELRRLSNDGDLNNKMTTAVIVSANTLISGTPSADETAWAASVFSSPKGASKQALMAVLAENKDLTIAQIQGATDSALQAQVDVIVPTLVTALAGA